MNQAFRDPHHRFSTIPHLTWWLMGFSGALLVTLVIWVFFGYIPIKIEGRGILVSDRGLFSVRAKVTGTVAKLRVSRGAFIKKGEFLLQIRNPEVQLKFQEAQIRVLDLQEEVAALRVEITEEKRAHVEALRQKIQAAQFHVDQLKETIAFLTNSLQKHGELLKKGLISGSVFHMEEQNLMHSKIDLETANSELEDLLAQEKKEYRPEDLYEIEQKLLAEKDQLDQYQVLLSEGDVYSPRDGHVLEVFVAEGDHVEAGTHLVWAENMGPAVEMPAHNELIYGYFSVDTGKRLFPQAEVEMRISTINFNEYGYLLGHVIQVSPFAVSKDNILSTIANPSLVNYLLNGHPAVVEAIIKPDPNPQHPDHFLWTSGLVPPLPIPTGTVGDLEATIERIRPIFYLLPNPRFKEYGPPPQKEEKRG